MPRHGALLLSIDPLASLAENQAQLQERLLSLTPTVSPELRLAWEAAAVGVLPENPHGRQFLSEALFRGAFEERSNQVVLTGVFTMHPWVKVWMTLWFGILGFFTLLTSAAR